MTNKFDNLKNYLAELEKQGICLAFSGGVDSTLLLYLCKDFNMKAVTFSSVFQTPEELSYAAKLCKKYKIRHTQIEFNPLDNKNLKNNPTDRCYHCKKLIFQKIKDFAQINNLFYIIDGTNSDDMDKYRPGLKALDELGIISPLAKFNITKQEIRNYLKSHNIDNYDKPSTPCLATRFSYGTLLNKHMLKIVYNGENILKKYGFTNNRLRIHNNIARIEIPPDKFNEFIKNKSAIIPSLKALGITYITLDVEGLRSGSMDINLIKNHGA